MKAGDRVFVHMLESVKGKAWSVQSSFCDIKQMLKYNLLSNHELTQYLFPSVEYVLVTGKWLMFLGVATKSLEERTE